MTRRASGQPVYWALDDPKRPDGPHIALVPGMDVPLLPLDLPDKLRGIARERVGKRMLVDQLAVPPDDLEMRPFAGSGTPGQWRRALVADARQLKKWRDRLSVDCLAMLPDYMALPCAPQVWTVEVADDEVRARLGPDDGFSAEPGMAAVLLSEAAGHGAPKAVLRLGAEHEAIDAVLAATKAPAFKTVETLIRAGFDKPMRWTVATRGLNLKDPPSAAFDRLRDRIAAWRMPVIFAILALAAYLGSVVFETRQLQESRLRDQTIARDLVREHFVATGPILDIRAQVTSALQAAMAPEGTEQASDPLMLFQTVAPYLTDEGVSLRSVAFRPDTGLVAAVEGTDFAALDRLVEGLRDNGVVVELTDSSARQAGGVAARLRVLGER
jgi:general secretion pathway protein L